jgi:mRNA degradation ribonuclease J1/J2
MNAPFKLGAFEIEMVALNHSIPDPAALAIRTDAGTSLSYRRLEIRQNAGSWYRH